MILVKDIEVEGLKIRIGIRQNKVIFVGFPAYILLDRGSVKWLERKFKDQTVTGEHPLFSMVEMEMREYLRGERKLFDIPVHLCGTPFQQRVWEEIDKIPYGAHIAYSDIARKIGCEKGCQAVGNAVGANMLSIFIPCHRVFAKKGEGGYAWGVEVKRRLNEVEAGLGN